MCLLCPDNPLMNASRHVVELVGEELVQPEFVEATLEPPELLLEELPDLVVVPELLEELPDTTVVTEAPLELLLEELASGLAACSTHLPPIHPYQPPNVGTVENWYATFLTHTKFVTWPVEASATPPFATTPLTTVQDMPPQVRAEAVAAELAEETEAAPELLLEELPELLEEPLAGLVLAGVTSMEKAGRPLVVVPSLAVMTMLLYRPASGALGVPESSPVVSPKVAHTGLFWMPKVRGAPLGFATVG
jgi:hypothetical protein